VTRFPRLAGLAEVAILAGKSKRRAWQITRERDFPAPVQTLAMGPVWLERDVQKYLGAGRPALPATAQCPACQCDPANPATLGRHGGASCVNPDCPAGCYEMATDPFAEEARRNRRARNIVSIEKEVT
jgi:predicted DNA-binding transcriptional regulator AlpA